jgi:hypothetical protein
MMSLRWVFGFIDSLEKSSGLQIFEAGRKKRREQQGVPRG